MKMNRLILPALGAVLLASAPILRAADERPDAPPPGERREQMGDRLAERLGLTADQKAKWKAINEQERADMKALRDNTALAKDERRAKTKEIHDKYRAERDAVLTAEQRAKAEQLRDRMEKHRERREDNREKSNAS